MTIRVFVVDDHTLFRDGLAALLNEQEDLICVGTASDGQSVDAIVEARPHVVLMDVNMPAVNGIAATRHLLQQADQVRVVMVSMVEDEDSMFASLEAGARGYVLKGSDVSEMLGVIRAVAAGQIMFGGVVAERMLSRLQAGTAVAPRTDGLFAELTPRERELLDLIARGMSNDEISKDLFISPVTVRNHITNVFSKLRVSDRAQAIVVARRGGYGQAP